MLRRRHQFLAPKDVKPTDADIFACRYDPCHPRQCSSEGEASVATLARAWGFEVHRLATVATLATFKLRFPDANETAINDLIFTPLEEPQFLAQRIDNQGNLPWLWEEMSMNE